MRPYAYENVHLSVCHILHVKRDDSGHIKMLGEVLPYGIPACAVAAGGLTVQMKRTCPRHKRNSEGSTPACNFFLLMTPVIPHVMLRGSYWRRKGGSKGINLHAGVAVSEEVMPSNGSSRYVLSISYRHWISSSRIFRLLRS